LRVYSPPELRELTSGLADSGYHWRIGCEKRSFLRLPITFLVGYPSVQNSKADPSPAA
jgi:hypothetical protein